MVSGLLIHSVIEEQDESVSIKSSKLGADPFLQDEYQNPSFLEQIRVQRLLEEAKMQVRLSKKETQKSRLSDVKPPRKPSDKHLN